MLNAVGEVADGPLCIIAANQGYKEIVELLIAKGAGCECWGLLMDGTPLCIGPKTGKKLAEISKTSSARPKKKRADLTANTRRQDVKNAK